MPFSQYQINCLITGTQLSAEIPSSSPELRHFVTIWGYKSHGMNDKYLKSEKIENMLFRIRDYEIENYLIENHFDIHECELINSFFMSDIVSIKNAEKELSKHISDFSLLVSNWQCSNPL